MLLMRWRSPAEGCGPKCHFRADQTSRLARQLDVRAGHSVVHRRGLRPIRRIQGMTFSKPPLGVSLTAFVFCVFAVLGPSTGPLLADGTIAPRSFQSGGVSALDVTDLFALPAPDRTFGPRATNEFSNNKSARQAHVVVQACKPSGAACSLPGECCSNSCVPPGFGGEPTCR
jgi:hypothetical protein